MPTYRLKPLDETDIDPEDIGRILELGEEEEPFFEGDGDTSYVCGRCGQTIVKDVEKNQISGLGFVCSGCSAYLYLPAH